MQNRLMDVVEKSTLKTTVPKFEIGDTVDVGSPIITYDIDPDGVANETDPDGVATDSDPGGVAVSPGRRDPSAKAASRGTPV